MSYRLKYPLTLYPRWIIQDSFKFTERCKKMLLELHNWISRQIETPPKLWYVAVGAAAEERYVNGYYTDKTMFHLAEQWRQLFPYFVEETSLKNPEVPIEVTIIAPNKHLDFRSRKFKQPVFVDKTMKQFEWKIFEDDNDVLTYLSTKTRLTVKVFCTPFPSYVPTQNEFIDRYIRRSRSRYNVESLNDDILRLQSSLTKENISDHRRSMVELELTEKKKRINTEKNMLEYFEESMIPRAMSYKNSYEDQRFVSDFVKAYRNLMRTIYSNNGITATFSFAVFMAETEFSWKYAGYKLVPSLLSIYKDNHKDILAEWYYRESCYCVTRTGGETRLPICFIKPTHKLDGYHLEYQTYPEDREGCFGFVKAKDHFPKPEPKKEKDCDEKKTQKAKVIRFNKMDDPENNKFHIFSAVYYIMKDNHASKNDLKGIFKNFFPSNINIDEFVKMLSNMFGIKIYISNQQKRINPVSGRCIYITQRDDEGYDVVKRPR